VLFLVISAAVTVRLAGAYDLTCAKGVGDRDLKRLARVPSIRYPTKRPGFLQGEPVGFP
jgi:hypothetical protein